MDPTEIKLLSTTALKTSIDELTARFESASGKKIVASYAPSTQIAKRVAEGEFGDFAITTDRKSTRLNSSHIQKSRMPSSA